MVKNIILEGVVFFDDQIWSVVRWWRLHWGYHIRLRR